MPSLGMRAPAPRASSSLVGLMRLTTFCPGVFGSVIFDELDVSTRIGTPCWAASGIMASVIDEPQAPMMIGTLSRTMSFSAALRVSAGSDLLSSITSSSGRPSTPPLALMRSTAILAALVMYEPAAAMGPESGWIKPILIGSLVCALAGAIPIGRSATRAARAADTTVFDLFMDVRPPWVCERPGRLGGYEWPQP